MNQILSKLPHDPNWSQLMSIKNMNQANGHSSWFLLVSQCLSVLLAIWCLKVGTFVLLKFHLLYFILSKLGNKNYDVLITSGFILLARAARENQKNAAGGYRSSWSFHREFRVHSFWKIVLYKDAAVAACCFLISQSIPLRLSQWQSAMV